MPLHRLIPTVADLRAQLAERSQANLFVLVFSVAAVVTVVGRSATLPAPIDHWEYASWYVEESLLRRGFTAPNCQSVLAIGNYATHWPKICTRIQSPGLAYAKAGLTATTGVDFTGRWQRYFLLTPALKVTAGYLLASLYTDNFRYRLLGATALFLVPDYTPFYVTQAKGLSFVILQLGVYARIRWHREGGPWLVASVLAFGMLLLFYFPRSLVLFTFYVVLSAVELRNGRPIRSVLGEMSANGVLFYVIQFDELLRKLSLLTAGNPTALFDLTALQLVFATSSGSTIPFLYESDSTSAFVVLLPVAVIAGLAGVRALWRRRVSFFADERMLWLYSLALIYVPAALAVSFFRTRIVFEAAIPGLLVAVDELDSLSDRAASVVEPLLVVVLAGLVVGNVLLLAPTVSYSADYRGLSDELERQGIDEETPVYTDLRTGAYLVGEEQYERVYRIVSDYDRDVMVDVWYGTNATVACEYMRATGSTHFVLNPVVTDGILFVENYPREPIDRSAYEKFERSPLFDRIGTHHSFRIYRVDGDCAV